MNKTCGFVILCMMLSCVSFANVRFGYDGSAFEHIKFFTRGVGQEDIMLIRKQQVPDPIELRFLDYSDRYAFKKVRAKIMMTEPALLLSLDRWGPHHTRAAHMRIICRYHDELVHCSDVVDLEKNIKKGEKMARTTKKVVKGKKTSPLIVELNALLASEYVLFTKTLKYHWNIVGVHFHGLHKLFDDHYHELLEIIDAVAERVRALNGIAFGTLQEFTKHAVVREEPRYNPNERGMLLDLVTDHEAIVRQIRPVILIAHAQEDEGTINFLGGLLEKHEKMAWMLRAHLAPRDE